MTDHPLSFTLEKHNKGGTLQFLIYGDIGMDFFGEGVSARNIVEVLSENQDVGAIEVRINSGGGSAFDGIAIYNVLRQHPAPVTVFVDGIAASAASITAMAGNVVNIATGAMMMIHNSANGAHGDNREHRKMAQVLAALDQQIAAVYMDRNGLNLKDTLALMEAETWFGAAEAVEAGMADNVVGAVEAVASVDLAGYGYRKVPKALAGERGVSGAAGTVLGWTRAAASPFNASGTVTIERHELEKLQALTDTITAPQPAHGENDMKIFAQAAGLTDGATEAEIVAKIQNVVAGAKGDSIQAAATAAQLTAITAAIGASGDEALGKIEAGKVALAMVEEQTAELAAIKASAEKDAHAALVVQGKKAGQLTADLVTLFENKSSDELKAFLAVAPKTVPMDVELESADDGAGSSYAALTYNGKKYADLSGRERAALAEADATLFKAMSDQYRASLNAA